VARKAFTVSVPSEALIREADFCGIAAYSGRDTDKFTVTGLTAVRSEVVDAPYVQECPLVVECRLVYTFELGRHTQFVGEIMDVKADAEVLDERGTPDIARVRPLIFAPGSQTYYAVGAYLGRAFAVGKELAEAEREE
jgi:flavin reductase (DIM6/NTAB) family NADH-FMN oxidoreductase RutF